MKIDFNIIGNAIREHRIRHGFTQEQLSEYAEITPGYLSKIENGFAKPTLETLLSLAICLGVSVDELVFPNGKVGSNDITSRMILKLLEECSTDEKELIYLILKEFISFLVSHGIRL